jgi:prolipoprotein diacylglyceryltransferase
MKLGPTLLILALGGLLVAAFYVSYKMWTSISGADAGMNGNGVAALVIGGIGTLVLGGGLMWLVFYSSRRGYDDAADLKSRGPEDR